MNTISLKNEKVLDGKSEESLTGILFSKLGRIDEAGNCFTGFRLHCRLKSELSIAHYFSDIRKFHASFPIVSEYSTFKASHTLFLSLHHLFTISFPFAKKL
jgi:hypothetical protein